MELAQQQEEQQSNSGQPHPNPDPFFSSQGGSVVDQPALGISVDHAQQTDVEIPLPESAVPEQEYNFSFRTEPSVGHRFSVVATCIETGEEQSYIQESKEAAEAFITEKVSILAAVKAERQQRRLEQEAAIKPFMAGDQVVVVPVDPLAPVEPTPVASLASIMGGSGPSVSAHQTPLSRIMNNQKAAPVEPTLVTEQPGLRPNIPGHIYAAPLYKGELVLKVRTDKKNPMHVIPELASSVAHWLGSEEVEKAEATDEGLKIITHPSFRKATFSYINGRVNVC